MLSRVADAHAIAEAVSRRRTVADGPGDFNEEWVRGGERCVLPEESGRHLEWEDCQRLAAALEHFDIGRLTAIANDPLVVDEMVYDLEATPDDLALFSKTFSGINVLLFPATGVDVAVLFSTDDYHLVAGSREFVTDYAGDLEAAKEAFLSFAEDHLVEDMRPTLRRIGHYLSWLDDSR